MFFETTSSSSIRAPSAHAIYFSIYARQPILNWIKSPDKKVRNDQPVQKRAKRKLRPVDTELRFYEMCSSDPRCKTDGKVNLLMTVAIQLPDDAVAEPRTLDMKDG